MRLIYSHVLTLNMGDRTESAVLRDLQRHPFKPTILHIDFLRVSADRKLRVHVPLHFVNEETSRGVKQQGGVVSRALIDIEIACLPKDLPEFIEVDLSDLGMGEALHLSQVPLPAGVELADKIAPGSDQDAIVVSIHHAHGGEEAQAPPRRRRRLKPDWAPALPDSSRVQQRLPRMARGTGVA